MKNKRGSEKVITKEVVKKEVAKKPTRKIDSLLLGKSPLRGESGGNEVFYWFKESPDNFLAVTSNKVIVDITSQLPPEIFARLSIENAISPTCTMYYSKMDAFLDLDRALDKLGKR